MALGEWAAHCSVSETGLSVHAADVADAAVLAYCLRYEAQHAMQFFF